MGAEAVDWVTRKAKCERESAISLLRLWEALGDFGHVVQVMGERGSEKEEGDGGFGLVVQMMGGREKEREEGDGGKEEGEREREGERRGREEGEGEREGGKEREG